MFYCLAQSETSRYEDGSLLVCRYFFLGGLAAPDCCGDFLQLAEYLKILYIKTPVCTNYIHGPFYVFGLEVFHAADRNNATL